ncbi:GTPase [Parachlamydia sp. AcF125]|uniref:GTPase n=1 Tax=Parachlamydia sp. AcF125 TaxID=2795736 RepID=UPI001BC8DAC1|nr:GTPase [Parachlamydia sp. AcF125]MBS4167416.1 hypothetical protein [Parachlamydia sp. AcF125]
MIPIQNDEVRIFTIIAENNGTCGFQTTTPATTSIDLPADVEHTPANASTPNFNVNDLLDRKLANPSRPLQPEESIAVLMECIRRGEIEAAKAENRNLVVIIGNTGSGKSTFGNAICGCTMERVSPKSLGLTGVKKMVVVKPFAEGGGCDEIMPIGHTKESKTFMPQLAETENGMSLCDCPGFLDNRGHEINIANAVNIRKAFIQAQSVKVVILINFHALEADRSRGLRDMIKLCCDLFGSKENLVKYKDSILLGITQVPFVQLDEEQELLNDLKDFIRDTKLKDEFEVATLRELSERLFIYDPLDAPNLKYAGALTKEQVVGKIAELECIQEPQEIFKTVLNDSDIVGLIKICDQIQENIQAILHQTSLSENDFKKAAEHLESLRKLEIIEHRYVFELVANAKEVITRHFHEMIHRFDHCCADETYRLADESQAIFTALKQGVQKFDEQIQSQVGVKGLEEQYALFIKKKAAKQVVFELADLQKKFYEAFALYNFVSAKHSLDTIQSKLDSFVTEYSKTGISSEIDFKQLESFYTQTKAKYDEVRLKDLAQYDLLQLISLQEQFREACAQNKLKEANSLLDEIRKKGCCFETAYGEIGIDHNINIAQLESLYTQTKAKYGEAQRASMQLISLQEHFREACAQKEFKKAKSLLDKIRKKERVFETDYRETGIVHNVNILCLESLYIRIKFFSEGRRKAHIELSDLKIRFWGAYERYELELAKSTLDQLKAKVPTPFGITYPIDIRDLERFYNHRKLKKDLALEAIGALGASGAADRLQIEKNNFLDACAQDDPNLELAKTMLDQIKLEVHCYENIYHRKSFSIKLRELDNLYINTCDRIYTIRKENFSFKKTRCVQN